MNSTKTRTASGESLGDILDRYKVKQRDGDQVVKHSTYGFTTKITAEDFAVFETAVTAIYIHNMVGNMLIGDMRRFADTMLYYQNEIFDPNNIALPWIRDSWNEAECEGSLADYMDLRIELGKRKGIDAVTGKERDLYYALLD